MKVKELGEFGFIEKIAEGLLNEPERVVKGIGDDTAVLRNDGSKLQLFTTDMMVQDVHFSKDFSSPKEIGRKLMAVNISDIAAMGGKPTNGVISIGMTGEEELEFIEGIYAGIKEMAKSYKINIVGGDTVKSKELVLNLALLGEVNPHQVIYRKGAEPGDFIYVTGTLGDSAAGLETLLNTNLKDVCSKNFEAVKELRQRHLDPKPRLEEALILAESGLVSAMNDISDGLASELHEIGKESQVGCLVYEEEIPISKETLWLAKECIKNPKEWALFGGEDFQLVFTVKKNQKANFEDLVERKNLNVALIGQITTASEGFNLVDNKGKREEFSPKGYNHFS